MSERTDRVIDSLRNTAGRIGGWLGRTGPQISSAVGRRATLLVVLGVAAAGGYGLWKHPPFESLDHGEIAVRTNRFTGGVEQFSAGSVLVCPGVHQIRRFSTRDQVYRPEQSVSATGTSPFQSVEGLSIGVDLSVRYAIDPKRIGRMSRDLPDDIAGIMVVMRRYGLARYRRQARYPAARDG